jgi:predicted RND superfamily exporter protein
MSCLRSLLSLLLTLGGVAFIVYGVTHWSGGSGNLVEVGLGGVLILLGIVNSARIVNAQEENRINRLIDRRLQNRR